MSCKALEAPGEGWVNLWSRAPVMSRPGTDCYILWCDVSSKCFGGEHIHCFPCVVL